MKSWTWKKRVLVTVGALVIATAVILPTTLFMSYRADVAEREKVRSLEELLLEFQQQYGTEAQVVSMVEPGRLYVFVWDGVEGNVTVRHYTLSINGLFVELGRFELT